MTVVDGWTHDRWGAGGMLNVEALLALAITPLGLAPLYRIRSAPRPLPSTPSIQEIV